jgi:hypothetical protein
LLINYDLLYARTLNWLRLEAGPGLQTWTSAGTYPAADFRIGYVGRALTNSPIEDVLFGYSFVFATGNPSQQYLLGMQFRL